MEDMERDQRDSKDSIKVLLADDHTLVRQGIENLLEGEEDIAIVSEASDGYEVLERAEETIPDIVIVDISMPRLNGLEATRRLKSKESPVKVILLSMYDDEEYIRRALRVGAEGYVLKEGAIGELVDAIKNVMDGEYYLSPPILSSLVRMFRRTQDGSQTDKYDELTSREREVLQLIAEGNSNKEIAEILSRSVETVRTHRAHIMNKLDLHSASELTHFAVDRGIVKEEEI